MKPDQNQRRGPLAAAEYHQRPDASNMFEIGHFQHDLIDKAGDSIKVVTIFIIVHTDYAAPLDEGKPGKKISAARFEGMFAIDE